MISAPPIAISLPRLEKFLYVPAGFPHTTDTVTGMTDGDTDPSVHLTVGVDTHIWGLNYATLRAYSLSRSGTQVHGGCGFVLVLVFYTKRSGVRPNPSMPYFQRDEMSCCRHTRPLPSPPPAAAVWHKINRWILFSVIISCFQDTSALTESSHLKSFSLTDRYR